MGESALITIGCGRGMTERRITGIVHGFGHWRTFLSLGEVFFLGPNIKQGSSILLDCHPRSVIVRSKYNSQMFRRQKLDEQLSDRVGSRD